MPSCVTESSVKLNHYLLPSRRPVDREMVPTPETHVRCPDCRELVRMDARRCKHCGVGLIPQSQG